MNDWITELALTDEEFAQVEMFASSPPPVAPPATADEVRKIIAFLAATLKMPATGDVAGRLKLGGYRIALSGLSKPALEFAATHAIHNLEWMPAPAQLKAFADGYATPDERAHAHAVRLVRDRKQRLANEAIRALQRKETPEDALPSLSPLIIASGIALGILMKTSDGKPVYRTAHAIEAEAAKRAIATDERDKRAGGGGDE